MSSTYRPSSAPTSWTAAVLLWIGREFRAIKTAWEAAKPHETLQARHASPDRLEAGMLVFADGTDWNPGNGAGLYLRNEANDGWIQLVKTTNKLSAFAATTSAELKGVISDETGSGALVFGTAPTLTTPTIAGATFTDDLLFSADAAHDIGASGASRPQDITAFRHIRVNGTTGAFYVGRRDTGADAWFFYSAAGSLAWQNAGGGDRMVLDTSGNLELDGSIRCNGTISGGIGYATGAGGTVSQAASKTTGVTLNKACGQVTMNNAALAAGAKVSFVVTNSVVAATDGAVTWVVSGGTANAYRASVTAVAAGSFTITVENITAGSLSESPVIGFSVIKAVTA